MLRNGLFIIAILIALTSCGTTVDQSIDFASAEDEINHEPKLNAHFINVGQAEATLFHFVDRENEYAVLFDTGDVNKKDVVEYLKRQKIKALDLVVVSHPDDQHIGQMAKILDDFSVKEVWFSGNTAPTKAFQRAAESVLASGLTYYEPRTGDIFDIGQLTLEVLNPGHLTGKIDEDSISIRFTYGNISFLLTGDTGRKNELEMMKRATTVKAHILQLGSHGSDLSSDPKFIKAVKPQIAIYSAGAKNPHGHPHGKVVSLIKREGIDLYGTDVYGTIIITTDGDSYDIVTEKEGKVTRGKARTENKKQGE